MTTNTIQDLVIDWDGFEQLIAQLHESGEVIVERDVKLKGRSGANRQIDVLVRHRQGLYEHLIIIECKFWNKQISRLHVDALATAVRDLGAARGVIFSTKGFQKGAVTQAEHEGISLFKLREPTDREWGLPGRHVDVWIQVVGATCGKIAMPGLIVAGPPTPGAISVDLRMGGDSPSQTPLKVKDHADTTLEAFLAKLAKESVRRSYEPVKLEFGGAFNGELKRVLRVNFKPKTPATFVSNGRIFIAPEMTFLAGFQVSQSRLQIDRGSSHAFVLAVEDCIQRTVTLAAKRGSEDRTELLPVSPEPDATARPFQNGTILTAWLGDLIPFDEFEGLEPASDAPERQFALGDFV